MSTSNQLNLVEIKKELNTQIADKDVFAALLQTTFKGLQPETAKQAMLEAMMRGYEFKDFLNKNIYAVPFGGKYSLVTSIDYARKLGMRNNVIGKSEPVYEEKDGKIISCAVTIQRNINGLTGSFTAKVYFDEYNTNQNQWRSKPRTMLAKVAEMHALRMACPEDASQMFIEEEYQKDSVIEVKTINVEEHAAKLNACKTLDELKTVWASLPAEAKQELGATKEDLKKKLAITTYENTQVRDAGSVDGSAENKDNGVKA